VIDARCELDHRVSPALGVAMRHRGLGQVATVAGMPFVVNVGEDGADESDERTRIGEEIAASASMVTGARIHGDG
jgi:hypothetical protein